MSGAPAAKYRPKANEAGRRYTDGEISLRSNAAPETRRATPAGPRSSSKLKVAAIIGFMVLAATAVAYRFVGLKDTPW